MVSQDTNINELLKQEQKVIDDGLKRPLLYSSRSSLFG